jgi:Secretion system C-terminal sorting domain
MRKIYSSLLLLCLSCLSLSVLAQPAPMVYSTAGAYTYTVGSGVTSVGLDVRGAQGGNYSSPTQSGGKGGRVQATLAVSTGEVLYVYVGKQAASGVSCSGSSGGSSYGGGEDGGSGTTAGCGGAGGGAASDIRLTGGSSTAALLSRLVVGGGGGGSSYDCGSHDGGAAGYPTGTAGVDGCGYGGGGGASQTGPGTAGPGGGSAGGFGYGGAAYYAYYGGGGGGGWYGGGGAYSGSGGGGSNYTTTTGVLTGVTETSAYQTGDGYVSIQVLCNAPGTIVGSSSVCFGSTVTYTNPTGATGGTWSSSSTATGTINSTTGAFTAINAGTTTLTYTVPSPCGSLATLTVTVSPAISVSGTPNVCVGNSRSLTPSPTGGTFSTTASAFTVGATSGLVSGVSAGTGNVTYTLGSGCSTIVPFTVNGTPATISGASAVCVGATTTMTDLTSGGTWSSSDVTKATISSGGTVTGVGSGTATIIYTSSAGCATSNSLTVNSAGTITGVFGVCLGSTSTLSDVASGGTWSSSNVSVATVGSLTGIVSSVGIGSSTIAYTIGSSGCSTSTSFGVSSTLFSVFSVSGGSTVCAGVGSTISLSGSNNGVSYQLYNGTTPVGVPVVGSLSGAGFSFAPVTGAGTYNVIANPGSSCAATMSGSATVIVNALPTQYAVSAGNGGFYCSGGTGVHAYLSSSQVGVTYQLLNSSSIAVSTMSGTSSSLDFGLVTSGTYTVVGNNTTTGCSNSMSNSITVTTNPLPVNTYSVTGTGGYCSGGSGVALGLSPSDFGVSYQLYYSGAAVGSPVLGNGASISLGTYTGAGAYSVVATNTVTGCTSTMTSVGTISVNTLPTQYSLTGGGAFCVGGTGVPVGLGGSTSGVTYQLFLGSSTTPVYTLTGTGSAFNFSSTVTTPGSYSVVATNPAGCSAAMFGSVIVTTNPLPTAYGLTGGGSYCAGGTGLHVGLAGSNIGINYQLYIGTSLVGGASGSGGAVDFGLQLTAGTYTVIATNTGTSCTNSMSGSATIVINALPSQYTLTGSNSYCAGGTGVQLSLTGSTAGVTYYLYNGTTSVATVSGIGSAVSFPAQTAAGSYTATGVSAAGCSVAMLGSGSISINPLPTLYNMTGGGAYCFSGTGTHVGLASSNIGISYQLISGGGSVGAPMGGTGSAIDFGLETAAGTYTVMATNTTTTCSVSMSGSAVVAINTLPVQYTVSITGTGAYCMGSSAPHIQLSNSANGINYQLYLGTSTSGSPISGTGFGLDFGPQATAGTYTIVATNPSTLCSSNMFSSGTVVVNALPTPFNVTQTSSAYCFGTAAPHIGLNSSTTGMQYQLYNGAATSGAYIVSTGGPLDFGAEPTPGTYTVVALNPTTSCTVNMVGSASIIVDSLPTLYNVTGGGPYCFGGTGVHIGLSGSLSGTTYQLMTGVTSVGAPLSGFGTSLDFGLQTAAGTYSIVATIVSTGCTRSMSGSTAISINSLPLLHDVEGTGSYCPGGSGLHVSIDGSDVGINYQVYSGSSPVSGVLGGTGSSLDFGAFPAGTYSILATNAATSCTNNMLGTAAITIAPLPTAFTVSGGGNYCPGGVGVHVGLSGSSSGVRYQLYQGVAALGASIAGTGLALDFGAEPAGTYTVNATTTSTGCSTGMTGNAVIHISTPPATYNVTGGGSYCSGSTGVHVGMDNSSSAVTYQLYNGLTPVGSPITGTGSPLDFGLQTGGGTYTVEADGTATTCVANMAGSASIVVNSLPVQFSLTGGGVYCSGAAGTHVGLAGSVAGVSYQLYNNGSVVGASIPGSGTTIDFGVESATGTYTVIATDGTTSCTNGMNDNTIVSIGALPVAYNVSGGGSYCSGGAGVHVTLGGSNTGISYQLSSGSGPVGTAVSGTGSPLDFGAVTGSGTYTVIATDNTTMCTNSMTGSAAVVVNALPLSYTLTSTGSTYCIGGPGVDFTLTGSQSGINYQVMHGTVAVGSAVSGTGTAIDLGYQTATGAYSVVATNATTGCMSNMAGSVAVAVTSLPTVYTITGGGNYCPGGTGVSINLSGTSTGTNYQLYANGTPVGTAVAGTGSSINFGPETITGTYTVVAENVGTTCTSLMSGAAMIGLNPAPTVYAVTGGGNYCSGGAGMHVGIGGSSLGINYQLVHVTTPVGAQVAGTGSALDLGAQTASGAYVVVATNPSTGCTSNMSGSATIGINPVPTVYTITGGGGYCSGSTGVHIGLSGSSTGDTYALSSGGSSASTVFGSGSSVDFGPQTTAGAYNVVATDITTGCTSVMSGTASVSINPLPSVYTVTGGGSYCAGGSGVHIGLNGSVTGISYQLYDGFTSTGVALGTGSTLDFGLEVAAGTYTVLATNLVTTCSRNMSGSTVVDVNPLLTPMVNITSSYGDTVCAGSFINFTASSLNAGVSPSYQWSVNSVSAGVGSTYGYIPNNGDVITVTMVSSAACATPAIVSNTQTITVHPKETPTVVANAVPGNEVCSGSSVTFNAANTYGGTAPSYNWIVNTANAGTGSSLTIVPSNGDVVYCVLTSNYDCRIVNTVISNHIVMDVADPFTPIVAITEIPGTSVAPGQDVVFSATVTNSTSGTFTYQWYINGVEVPGATGASYETNTLTNGQSVSCVVSTTGACSGITGTSSVVMHVGNVGVQQLSSGNATIQLVPNPNKGLFVVKGSLASQVDQEVTFDVTDMVGKVVYTAKSSTHNGEINETIQLGANIANGMYLLTMHTDAGTQVFHVVVEQ